MNSLIILLTLASLSMVSTAQTTTWIAPAETKTIKNPFEESDPTAVALMGKTNFELLCTVCHGETGRGDGVTLEYLNPKPANLTSKRVQDQTAGEIYWNITTGRSPMQSYANVLSSSEIWQIITYIESFGVED